MALDDPGRALLDGVLASCEDTFLLVGPDGTCLYAHQGNDMALAAPARPGRPLAALLPSEVAAAAVTRLLAEVTARGLVVREELGLPTPLGLRAFSVTAAPVGGWGVAIAIRDVSACKQLAGLLAELPPGAYPGMAGYGALLHDGRTVLAVDEGLAAMLRLPPAALVGRPLRQVLRDGQVLPADGKPLPVAVHRQRLVLEGSAVELVTLLDTHRHGQATEALRLAADHWAALVDSTPQLVVAADRTGTITFVNGPALGLRREQLVGRNLLDLQAPGMRAAAEQHIQRVLATGAILHFDTYLHDVARGTVWLRSTMAPIRRDGATTGVLISAQDITDLVRLEADLERQERELSNAQHVASQHERFARTLVHELRTPLTAMLGFAELLDDGAAGELSPLQHGYVQQIRASAQRQAALVETLLDQARLEAGTFRLRPAQTDLAALLQADADALMPLARNRGLALELAPGPRPLWVQLDPQRIDEVVVNLLANALKFTPPGGKVVLAASDSTGQARVEVRDTGPGITEADRARLFQGPGQLEQGLREGSGLGLGLSICKAIVEAHGGEIGVGEGPEGGTTFWFTLPR